VVRRALKSDARFAVSIIKTESSASESGALDHIDYVESELPVPISIGAANLVMIPSRERKHSRPPSTSLPLVLRSLRIVAVNVLIAAFQRADAATVLPLLLSASMSALFDSIFSSIALGSRKDLSKEESSGGGDEDCGIGNSLTFVAACLQALFVALYRLPYPQLDTSDTVPHTPYPFSCEQLVWDTTVVARSLSAALATVQQPHRVASDECCLAALKLLMALVAKVPALFSSPQQQQQQSQQPGVTLPLGEPTSSTLSSSVRAVAMLIPQAGVADGMGESFLSSPRARTFRGYPEVNGPAAMEAVRKSVESLVSSDAHTRSPDVINLATQLLKALG